jgi:WD40 repeat protein
LREKPVTEDQVGLNPDSIVTMKKQFVIRLGLSGLCLVIVACQAINRPTSMPVISSPPPIATTPIRLLPSATHTAEAQTTLCFSPAEILPFAFTPDSARLLSRTRSGVQVINLKTGQADDFLQAPLGILTAVLSPDGETLAWSLEDNSIQLVSFSSGQALSTLTGHPDPVYHLRFSPSGDRLYSASHDGWVRIWDMQGKPLPSLQAGREILGLGISPDGSTLAAIPGDGPVSLWDLAENKMASELGGSGGYDTSDAVFSPDGQYLAADLVTGLFLWRVTDGSLVWNDIHNSLAVTYSPDGRFLAYSDVDDHNKVILATPDGKRNIREIEGMQGPVWELFFSPNSSLLAATDGQDIRIWQVQDSRLLYIGKSACP